MVAAGVRGSTLLGPVIFPLHPEPKRSAHSQRSCSPSKVTDGSDRARVAIPARCGVLSTITCSAGLRVRIGRSRGEAALILGMTTFTAVHVLLSLIGIVSGLVVLFGLLTANLMNGWTVLFLATTFATSVPGFFFPFHGFTPALGVGIL